MIVHLRYRSAGGLTYLQHKEWCHDHLWSQLLPCLWQRSLHVFGAPWLFGRAESRGPRTKSINGNRLNVVVCGWEMRGLNWTSISCKWNPKDMSCTVFALKVKEQELWINNLRVLRKINVEHHSASVLMSPSCDEAKLFTAVDQVNQWKYFPRLLNYHSVFMFSILR